MLNVGGTAGRWIVEDLVRPGLPGLYRVRHAEVGSLAQLKCLPLNRQTEACQRREVAALGQIAHPCLPEVLDFGLDPRSGVVWTVFRLFEGESLVDRLQQGPLPWEDACGIFREIADALAAVHGRGLVHRDLRPSNLLLSEGVDCQLGGFDFAMLEEDLDRMSEVALGDLAYLAPEVLEDPRRHGAKADTYALGCTLYEALTGTAPFTASVFSGRPGATAKMLEWKTRAAALDPGPECPDWLRSLVVKATQPDPDRRLPDIGAMVGWLDGARPQWERAPSVALSAAWPLQPPGLPALRVISPSMRITQPLSIPRSIQQLPRRQAARFPTGAYLAAAASGWVGGMTFSSLLIALMELGRAG